MIKADFKKHRGYLVGFSIKGHAGYAESGHDVVCAAVSSAIQLIVNIMDKFGCGPRVSVEENLIDCSVGDESETVNDLLEQLRLHIEAILEEFPNTIKITISEV